MRRRLVTLLLSALAVLGLGLAAPAPAGAVIPTTPTTSKVCTVKGSCVAVTKASGINRFTVTVLTCKRGDSFQVGLRGYFSSRNWTTSPPRTVTCGSALPKPATRTYVGNRIISWKAFVGPAPARRFGNLAGAPLDPTGGHEVGTGFGFHWD